MQYLLKYSAEVDGDNGPYNEDFTEVKDSIEEICEDIANLELENGEDFSYEIFELHEFDSSSIKNNEVYLNRKKEIEFRESVSKLKDRISNKNYHISDLKSAKNRYGEWEKFNEQLSAMEYDLLILENQLKEKLRK